MKARVIIDNGLEERKSKFLSKWKKDMMVSMKRMHPEWDEDKMSEIIDDMIDENLQDPIVICDNNYTHENKTTYLLDVVDWLMDEKPIMGGNGTFYQNQDTAINPNATMVNAFLKERKQLKKQMFSVEDENSEEYKALDRAQGNKKRLANSYYGGSGAKTSAFYSKWSAPATTLTAQSVISTCESTIEAFLGNNFLFINLNECIHWMNLILKEEPVSDDWLVPHTVDDVFERLKSRFYDYNTKFQPIILDYLNNRTQDELNAIYYKNNITAFTKENEYVRDLYEKVFANIEVYPNAETVDEIPSWFKSENSSLDDHKLIKAWNGFANESAFLNPNKIPTTVSDYMEEIKELYMKYVYIDYIIVDKIYRLRKFKRDSVVIVDTDSCIIQMDTWASLCKDYIMKSQYGRNPDMNEFIAVNSMTAILTDIISDILYKYSTFVNICEDHKRVLNMKNEFLFTKLIIGTKKKRYMSLIKVREGTLLKHEKYDVKGFDYMKSGTSESAKEFFDHIVGDYMLYSDEIDVGKIRMELDRFSKSIYDDLQEGNTKFLPLLKVNEFSGYKDPYSQQGVRGAIAWNILYPDETVEFPVSLSALKLTIVDELDIEPIRYENPEIYQKLLEVLNHEMTFKRNKEGKAVSRGLAILCIPQGKKIPDWCKPYIDYETIINTIIGKFKGVSNLLKIKSIRVGKKIGSSDRKTDKLSNIIGF